MPWKMLPPTKYHALISFAPDRMASKTTMRRSKYVNIDYEFFIRLNMKTLVIHKLAENWDCIDVVVDSLRAGLAAST